MKICMLTIIHPRFDNRIFEKEARSLSSAKYELTIIVSDGLGDESRYGYNIMDIGKYFNIFSRIRTHIKVLVQAIKLKAKVYHFHDPELMFIGFILKLLGKKVIYDVHEDNYTSILQKPYIPNKIRKVIAYIVRKIEKFSSIFFEIIIAEKYYEEFFNSSISVLNYPYKKGYSYFDKYERNFEFNGKNILYTGNLTKDRGLDILINLLNFSNDLNIYFIGKVSKNDLNFIKKQCKDNFKRFHIFGKYSGVEYSEILDVYKRDDFLCGIALFPKTEHYTKKELTKFFEYMAVGLPIIASNFFVWKEIIENNNVGITVDPKDIKGIIEVIENLHDNRDKLKIMSHAGKKAFNKMYNWNTEENKLLNLYNSIK